MPWRRVQVDIVVSDLKQEIVNGSTAVTPVPANDTYAPVYQPTSSSRRDPHAELAGPTPAAGQVGTIPNLIRISSTTAIAAPGADHPASAVSSTTASVESTQHFRCALEPAIISYLEQRRQHDSTPISGFTPPSWVFVNTKGPTVLSSPSTSVTGRYAYAVYNEGGLLDMNAAGYPSNQTIAQYGGKGASLAYADLSQLVDSSGTQLLTSSQIDQIVGWRNNASAQPAGTFKSFSFAASSPLNYFNYVATNPTSFLSVSGLNGVSGKTWNGNSDQAFLSRQELIGLQSAIGFPAGALQYMGTFSREVNAPTFSYPASGSYTNTLFHATASNDPTVNVTNLNILSLHMTQAGSAPDGFSWNAGDPLVCRRFPLGRLALVSYSATNTSTSSSIYKYFGLCRSVNTSTDASQPAWLYTGSSGGTTAVASIKTLDQVAAETPSREPNFFELLKAAIHSDSLGRGGRFLRCER